MKAINRLYCSCRVEERRVGERALGHVDEHPHPVRNVFVERAFETEQHAVGDILAVEGISGSGDVEQRRAGRHERAERGPHLQYAPGPLCARDEPVSIDSGDNSGLRRTNDVRVGPFRFDAFGIDLIEEPSRVGPYELYERGHAQRPPDVMDIQHEDNDADHDEQVCDNDRETGH